jgi:hypothetical protein
VDDFASAVAEASANTTDSPNASVIASDAPVVASVGPIAVFV